MNQVGGREPLLPDCDHLAMRLSFADDLSVWHGSDAFSYQRAPRTGKMMNCTNCIGAVCRDLG